MFSAVGSQTNMRLQTGIPCGSLLCPNHFSCEHTHRHRHKMLPRVVLTAKANQRKGAYTVEAQHRAKSAVRKDYPVAVEHSSSQPGTK